MPPIYKNFIRSLLPKLIYPLSILSISSKEVLATWSPSEILQVHKTHSTLVLSFLRNYFVPKILEYKLSESSFPIIVEFLKADLFQSHVQLYQFFQRNTQIIWDPPLIHTDFHHSPIAIMMNNSEIEKGYLSFQSTVGFSPSILNLLSFPPMKLITNHPEDPTVYHIEDIVTSIQTLTDTSSMERVITSLNEVILTTDIVDKKEHYDYVWECLFLYSNLLTPRERSYFMNYFHQVLFSGFFSGGLSALILDVIKAKNHYLTLQDIKKLYADFIHIIRYSNISY